MKKIFEVISLGNLVLKNRIIRSATMEFGKSTNGTITNTYNKLYESLAKGGAELLITGAMAVNKDSQVKKDMINIYSDTFLDNFKETVKLVHMHDCLIAPQIAHGGLISMASTSGKRLGPSAVIGGTEMTISDIKNVIHDFGNASLICKQAGADAVQIHAAHGFLISQFLSPVFNKRTDEYGGNITNRSRILFEIINAVKSHVGADFPILVKLNYSDLVPGGLTLEESMWICKKLDEKGLAAIEISSGLISDQTYSPAQILHNKQEDAYNLRAAAEIAESIQTPVICVGGFRDFSSMEEAINKSNLTAISLCRPLICEPDLPDKWKNDNSYQPKCISCNGCFTSPELECIIKK